MNESTALLVIDMQLCGFDGKITPPTENGAGLLDAVAKLIAAARQAEKPVIYIQHCSPDGQPYARGMHGWDIHPLVSPRPAEVVVQKRQSNGFEETDLESVLAQRGIDTVITCGIQSEYCLTNTSIGALERGLDVYVAGDAHGTVSTEEDDASAIVARQNAMLADRGARVQQVESLLEFLAAR